jgi:3-oxoadipate enol-lactonase
MPFAAVDHLQLYFEITGDGAAGVPALVLLHGLGSSSADWRLQVEFFAKRRRVITVDLRGHGRSLDGRLPASIAQMADDVAALLAELGEPPADVLGLSLGGCVAQALALGHQENVRALVLVNTFARLRPAGLRGVGRLARRTWLFATAPMPALAAFIAGGLFPRPEQRAYYDLAVARLGSNPKPAYSAATRAALRFVGRSALPRLRCPTLIVAGDRDTTVPRAAIDTLRRGIPHAQFALIIDSGHATPIDQAEAFNKVVEEFLQTLESKS